LSVVVIGASGDLAKKKTYPALFGLFQRGMLPEGLRIVGYARSKKTNKELRDMIRPYLKKSSPDKDEKIEAFLTRCDYHITPGYDSMEGMSSLIQKLSVTEGKTGKCNRVYYLAVPPFVFVGACRTIHRYGVAKHGWTRIVVEKPFGRDTSSSNELSRDLAALFPEKFLYRIDHYLGKEMVQSLLVLRFANQFFEPLWNHHFISCVYISFKEPFGTEGRGGYFDKYGIIRDVIQNHLLQVLSLVAMEPPIGT
jgi:glucose-6-phosphate 1-dehydrogenase